MNSRDKALKHGGWVAVDLDGTLAEYHSGQGGATVIGKPIPKMLKRVQQKLAQGQDVRIFTARVDGGEIALGYGDQRGQEYRDVDRVRLAIENWCSEHIGQILPITNVKDYGCAEIWDDRAIGVIENTGEIRGSVRMNRWLSSPVFWIILTVVLVATFGQLAIYFIARAAETKSTAAEGEGFFFTMATFVAAIVLPVSTPWQYFKRAQEP